MIWRSGFLSEIREEDALKFYSGNWFLFSFLLLHKYFEFVLSAGMVFVGSSTESVFSTKIF